MNELLEHEAWSARTDAPACGPASPTHPLARAPEMNHIEMPRGARVISAALGVLFLVLGGVVFAVNGFGDWKSVLGGALVLGVGIDFVLAAVYRHWPISSLFMLP
jgi:hypothetical protein